MKTVPTIFFFSFTLILFHALADHDTMVVNQTIREGQTIVSPQQTFELGFFRPENASENRYLGIWFKPLASGMVVWVANRKAPIKNNTGELTLHPDGVLVLRDSTTNRVIWSSRANQNARNPVARLLDSGNLMVIDDDNGPDDYIWQSFDYPGDTALPGMKFGRNLGRGIVTNFTSWKSADDPSPGPFMVYMDFSGLPQIYQKHKDVIRYRLGSWNGVAFTGRPRLRPDSFFKFEYVANEREVYTKFVLINTSVHSKMLLSPEGNVGPVSWTNRTKGSFFLSSPEADNCDRYAVCGAYGSCNIAQSPPCGCLKGFTAKKPNQWDLADGDNGCRRYIPLDCGVGEGFRKYSSMKLPDTRHSWVDTNTSLKQCAEKCRKECNCTAYTSLDIRYGTGCVLWYEELIDMRTFPDDHGQDIYIRMAALEIENDDQKISKSKKKVTFSAVFVIGLAISLGLCFLIVMKLKAKGRLVPLPQDNVLDLPLFDMSTLLMATNNFSDDNKIGEGGFGLVYKGLLEGGREVAVKRLSKRSTQGVEEFKNEVVFTSKLQHRNLVKILGCSIQGEEKLLVYEWMPNKGLDLFLFRKTEKNLLNWSQRFHIINGVARGLLYLHQDSILRIVHRDLKPANILLDSDMNPKISDFGVARSFGANETQTNTTRVVGTYGYMSPEYAVNGVFSVKSDVFSFGVLVLEIVSGKKNRQFFCHAHSQNLLGHAWILYKEGKSLELVDEALIESLLECEVARSIHVALLCVQNNPKDRPDMSMVVMMLNAECGLPEPRQPGFFTEDDIYGPESSSSIQTNFSNNNVTITHLDPR